MKKIIIIFMLIFILSCDIDQAIESKGEIDKDDINIIKEIGKQGLDKAIDLFNTRTFAS